MNEYIWVVACDIGLLETSEFLFDRRLLPNMDNDVNAIGILKHYIHYDGKYSYDILFVRNIDYIDKLKRKTQGIRVVSTTRD